MQVSLCTLAQENGTSNPSTEQKKDLKKEIIIKNKRFKIYNNWLSGGGGPAKNFNIVQTQFSGGVDYNFHISTNYFQAGATLSGDRFGLYSNYGIHFCYGIRKETARYNLAYFGGINYSTFFDYKNGKYSERLTDAVGIYLNAQFIQKLTYDVGFGPSVFADINAKRSIIGIRFDLYFSGAYKGKKE